MSDPITHPPTSRSVWTERGAEGDRYRALFEDAPIGIHVSDVHGTVLDCNVAMARLLGCASREEAIGLAGDAYHVPGQREAWVEEVRTRGRVEHQRGRLRRRDGRIVQVIWSAVGGFDREGQLIEVRGSAVDITRSVEAEDELKDRELRFRSVFLDAADAMLLLDDDRRIIDANRAAIASIGEPGQSLLGQALDEFLAPGGGEQLEAAWRELLAFGEAKREHALGPAGRTSRLVECSYRASVHGSRHLCIARDITDRRRLEERLVQSERIESVGRLAGGIAHDFNNLLTAILGYTELLLSHRGPHDPDRPDLEEIQKAGQRAAALTQRLLAYSRKQVLVPRDVDLNQAVSNLRSMLTRLIRADITLVLDLSSEPAVIRIDTTQLEQVIINLVLNSRDALPAGGTIRLEVARVRLSHDEVPSDQPVPSDGYVRLRVTDTGVGIAPEARAHLFEPFFTTKEFGKGTGLGLASVYGIVRQSNGFIGVESDAGRGTTFTMHFPSVSESSRDAGARDHAAAAPGGHETILLVEDEDAVRVIIGALLRRHGYRVLEAATPGEAFRLFAAHRSEIALLLSDVVMPEMNGPALAQRLVEEKPGLRVLLVSGYADGSSPIDCGNPNMSFLSKPFQASVLAARVGELLSRPAVTAHPWTEARSVCSQLRIEGTPS
jgi:PAS domain S-box-containing protein